MARKKCECCGNKVVITKRDSEVASRLCSRCWDSMTRFYRKHGTLGLKNPRPQGWQHGHVDAWLTYKEAPRVR